MADGPIAYPMEQDRPELSKLALLLSGYKAKAPDGVDPNAPAAVNPAVEPKSLYAVPGRMGGFSTNTPAEVAPPPVSAVAPGAPSGAVPPPLEDPLVQQVRSYRNASGARSNAIQSDMQRDAQPIDRNNPSVKPHWTDRLLGGLVGFGLGYGGNRNAAEIGGDVTNRKFNEAERQRGGRLAADTLASKEFDRGNQQYDRNIENEIRAQQLERQNSVEQREGKESDARIRNIDSQIKTRENPVAKPTAGKEPSNYEQTVVAYQNETDPAQKQRYKAAIDQMESAEKKKFAASNNRQPTEAEMWKSLFHKDNGREPTADEFAQRKVLKGKDGRPSAANNANLSKATSKKKADWADENSRFDTEMGHLRKLQSDPMKRQQTELELKQEHTRRLQEIQDNWEGELQRGGVGVVPFDVEKGKPAPTNAPTAAPAAKPNAAPTKQAKQLDADTARSYLKKAGGDKNKARQMAKGDGYNF